MFLVVPNTKDLTTFILSKQQFYFYNQNLVHFKTNILIQKRYLVVRDMSSKSWLPQNSPQTNRNINQTFKNEMAKEVEC